VAISLGCREDHGWAVYFTQGPRRRSLLDTVDGLSDDETLRTALAAWATFQPRKGSKHRNPGQLFYPAEASHVLEKYWNHLQKFNRHPDFASESQICQERMVQFPKAVTRMRHKDWTPKSVAEAEESSLHIAEDAALLRLRSVPDGPNQWLAHRNSADTGGTSQGADSSGSTAGLGSMGTCVT
jgi:hypothetical protein